MGKTIIVFLLIFCLSGKAEENTCRYEKTTQTNNGVIVSVTETKVCKETIFLQEKTWWESFIQSPEYTNTLIILLATLLN
jgi:hypothetical protein